ncbi:MAG: hypothetical protein PHS34_09140 [Candidatus Omnitrophica bacterium]|nr:hypothetical protein [Candidatus Omnitrophota bacterium]
MRYSINTCIKEDQYFWETAITGLFSIIGGQAAKDKASKAAYTAELQAKQSAAYQQMEQDKAAADKYIADTKNKATMQRTLLIVAISIVTLVLIILIIKKIRK